MQEILAGTFVADLAMHGDARGVFTEIFRRYWTPISFKQWNVVRSNKNVLRGFHVHRQHHDYLTVIDGEVFFGLHDLRPGSPTEGQVAQVTLSGKKLQTLYIPAGVGHGFYFVQNAVHVYAVSEYWNLKDELGCRFDDPGLKIAWPSASPQISKRDADLPSLTELRPQIPRFVPDSAHPPVPAESTGMETDVPLVQPGPARRH